MNKNKIEIALFLLIIFVSIFAVLFDNKNIKKDDDVLKTTTEMTEYDTIILKENYEKIENKGYSTAKEINYNVAMFFDNLLSENFEAIKLIPEYMAFLNISPSEYLNSRYKIGDVIFYEIVSIKDMKEHNKILVETKYKYENNNNFLFETFSLENKAILDKPFLFIKDAHNIIEFKDIIFSLENKAVFSDGIIYKINIKNDGENIFYIDDDKYGFYAVQDKNKYYHEIEGGDVTSYRIYPGAEKNLYVKFKNLQGTAGIFVKVNGKPVLLTSK